MATLQTTITARTIPSGEMRLYPNIVSYNNIGHDDIVRYMVESCGINKGVALSAVAALRQLFFNYVIKGHTMVIPELGTFSIVAKTKAVGGVDKCGTGCIKALKLRFTPVKSTVKACKSVTFRGIIKGDEILSGMIH